MSDLIFCNGTWLRVTEAAYEANYRETSVTLECVPVKHISESHYVVAPRGNGKSNMVLCDTFEIEKVIFNKPATIVLWKDGTKTVVKCSEYDLYDPQTGLLMCIAKKAYGNGGRFNDVIREHVTENPLVKAVRDMCQVVKTALEGRASEY